MFASAGRIAIGHLVRRDLLIVENCIVKNFHVPNMKAVRVRISVRVRMQFLGEGPSDRTFSKKENSDVSTAQTVEASVHKVRKSAQVDTLASQAMKDVASCDKLGGTANEY